MAEPAEVAALRYAAAVYGSILVAALVGALSDKSASAIELVGAVGAMLVFFLAHVWAEIERDRALPGGRLSLRHSLEVAGGEWPMIQAAAAPLAVLTLAWVGAWSTSTAVSVALAVCLVQLFGWGVVVARRAREPWPRALVSGAIDLGLGLVIVILKIVVHF
jgi:low affinity Fe/Cu permease